MIYNTYSQNMFNLNGYSMMNGMNFLSGCGYGYGCGSESMMWMSIGNMLANCTMTAVSQGVAAKKEAQANSPEVQLKDVEKEIESKTDAKDSLVTKYNTGKNELTKLENDLAGYKSELAKVNGNTNADKEKRSNLEQKIKELENTTIHNKEQEIKNLKEKIEKANDEIEKLKAKRDELKAEIQQAKDMKLFNKADGNIFNKRTNKDDLYKLTFDAKTCPATEADMRGAILALRKAQKGGNADTIKKAAGKAKEVYEALPDALKKQYSDAAAGIDRALNN